MKHHELPRRKILRGREPPDHSVAGGTEQRKNRHGWRKHFRPVYGWLLVVGMLATLAGIGFVVTSPQSSPPITAGNSKANCITPDFPGGVLNQSIIDGISTTTGVGYNCLEVFDNPMTSWANWETPWMFRAPGDGWDAWLAANPAHQVIMAQDLIPQSVSSNSDPLTWEQACASGAYDSYAETLAKNLVSYGAAFVVIRLSAWYPGNAYVNIIGADAYDKDCGTLKTVAQEGWQPYATDSSNGNAVNSLFPSLANIEAFAVAQGKPMSFPEWGLSTGDDDATYVTDLAHMFNTDDFAFQSYFDAGDDGIAPLGSAIPNATAAYGQLFK
jgi:hypothetical protein